MAICPGAHVALSPGRHVMLHAAQGPTAGALHEAPVSTFDFALLFFDFSYAIEGPHIRNAATAAMQYDFIIVGSLVEHSSPLLQRPLDVR
jgi:hypothetical protein